MTTPTPAPHVPPYGECFICFGERPCDEPDLCYPPPKPDADADEQEPEQ